MIYRFNSNGHPNIKATHKTTLEFTRENDVSLKGNCIIGVNADFELTKLKKFIKKSDSKNIIINLEATLKKKKIQENIVAELNSDFNSDKEIVIRKTDFISDRTFAIKSNKAAFNLRRDLIGYLSNKKNKIRVTVKNTE